MATVKAETQDLGVSYVVTCQNRGCGYTFEIRVTPSNVNVLASTLACPHCGRRGGVLERGERCGPRSFTARLVFKERPTLANPLDEEDF